MKLSKRFIIISMLLCFLMVGCGNDTKVIEGTSPDVEVNVDNGSSEEELTSEEENAEIKYNGYVYDGDGVTVEINAEAAPIIEALGEPAAYFESPSCAFEGMDKIYTYSHVEIYTYSEGEKDYISLILFKDDLVSTQEGISIGDSLDKVKETYGTEYSEEERLLKYSKDDMELCFIFDDGVVTSIEYRSTVL